MQISRTTSDRPATIKWYKDVLGVDMGDWGAFFPADQTAAKPGAGCVFSGFKSDTDYFVPSTRDFMINLVVDDLGTMLVRAASHGVTPVKTDDQPYGKFAHLIDPEGIKVELWEPIKAAT